MNLKLCILSACAVHLLGNAEASQNTSLCSAMSIQQQRQYRQQLLDEDDEAAAAAPVDTYVQPRAKPKFSARSELWTMFQLGWPMVASFVCRILMASTDTAFVGHLTNSSTGFGLEKPRTAEQYLASSALADVVLTLLIAPPLAFNQVLNALVGQAVGSGNPKMAGTWLQLSIFFLTIAYIPFLIAQWYTITPALRLLGFEEDLCRLAGVYARWQVIWPIPNGVYQCLRFYFQAQGLPRPAMYNNIVWLLLNGLLNWFYVFGGPFAYLDGSSRFHFRGFGYLGAAMSLSTSRSLQPVTYWLYMFVWRKAHLPTWPGINLEFLQCQRVYRFLMQALPLIGASIFQVASSKVQTVLIAQLGTLVIGTNSAVIAATMPASDTLSAALTAVAAMRVGFHLGKGDARAAKAATSLVLCVSVAISTTLFCILWPLRYPLVSLVTDDAQTKPIAAEMVGAQLVSSAVGVLVTVLTMGVLSGQGRTLVTTVMSFGVELPLTIGGTALLVYVAKLRGATGLLWILWVGGACVSLAQLAILGCILTMCTNWKQYAAEAQLRNEAVQADDQPQPEPAQTPAAVGVLQDEQQQDAQPPAVVRPA